MRNRKKTAYLLMLLLLFATALSMVSCGKEAQEQISTIEQLNGKKVVVVEGTTFAATLMADERIPDVNIMYGTSTTDGFVKFMAGKAEAYVTDGVVAKVLQAKNDGVLILDEALTEDHFGFVFTKGSSYTAEFNSALAEMKEDGSYDEIVEKWFGDDESVKVIPEYTGKITKGTLTCCIDGTNDPLGYLDDDGNLVGMDVELISEAANRLGYKIKFETDDFSNIIPTVSAGQADIGAGGITITDERKALVDFSDSYLTSGTVVMVKDASVNTTAKGKAQSVMARLKRTFVENDHWRAIINGLLVTILIAVATAILGYIIGYILIVIDYVYAERTLVGKIMNGILKVLSLSPASTLFYVTYYILFAGQTTSGFVAAGLVLTLLFAADTYYFYGTHIIHVKKGELEAAESMGYSRFETFKHIVMPQVFPPMVGELMGEVKVHVKTTALVGLVAVVDIQTVADTIRAETLEPAIPLILTAVVYIGLGLIFSKIVARIGRKRTGEELTQDQILENIERGEMSC